MRRTPFYLKLTIICSSVKSWVRGKERKKERSKSFIFEQSSQTTTLEKVTSQLVDFKITPFQRKKKTKFKFLKAFCCSRKHSLHLKSHWTDINFEVGKANSRFRFWRLNKSILMQFKAYWDISLALFTKSDDSLFLYNIRFKKLFSKPNSKLIKSNKKSNLWTAAVSRQPEVVLLISLWQFVREVVLPLPLLTPVRGVEILISAEEVRGVPLPCFRLQVTSVAKWTGRPESIRPTFVTPEKKVCISVKRLRGEG